MISYKMLLVGFALVGALVVIASGLQGPLHNLLFATVAHASALPAAQTTPTPSILASPRQAAAKPTPTSPGLQFPKFQILPQPVPDAVATRSLASFYGVSIEGINWWHDHGYSYDDIIRGYTLARMSERSPKEIFPKKSAGTSWDWIEVSLCGSTGHPVPTLADIVNGRAHKPQEGDCKKED